MISSLNTAKKGFTVRCRQLLLRHFVGDDADCAVFLYCSKEREGGGQKIDKK